MFSDSHFTGSVFLSILEREIHFPVFKVFKGFLFLEILGIKNLKDSLLSITRHWRTLPLMYRVLQVRRHQQVQLSHDLILLFTIIIIISARTYSRSQQGQRSQQQPLRMDLQEDEEFEWTTTTCCHTLLRTLLLWHKHCFRDFVFSFMQLPSVKLNSAHFKLKSLQKLQAHNPSCFWKTCYFTTSAGSVEFYWQKLNKAPKTAPQHWL